jgi:hypothetical protein
LEVNLQITASNYGPSSTQRECYAMTEDVTQAMKAPALGMVHFVVLKRYILKV